jgi:hypothetical protein
MKRSGPPKRKTALRSKVGLKRVALKRKAKSESSVLRESRKIVRKRSGGRCEARTPVCTGQYEHTHHIRLRSRGGSDEPGNLLAVDNSCHAFIHSHPALSEASGWMKSAWDNPSE